MLVMKRQKKWKKKTNQRKIRKLGKKETYKYMGLMEADTTKQVKMKEKLKKEYLRRKRKPTYMAGTLLK